MARRQRVGKPAEVLREDWRDSMEASGGKTGF